MASSALGKPADERYLARMASDDVDLDDWADYSDPGHDDEDDDEEERAAEIGTITAGRTVVPAAFAWWRTRRERRAEKQARSLG
jgi:hypothetical protein